jgi:hypothetical protein
MPGKKEPKKACRTCTHFRRAESWKKKSRFHYKEVSHMYLCVIYKRQVPGAGEMIPGWCEVKDADR